jgi:prophage antirepressor-like protein
MNDIAVFKFNESEVRTFTINGQPWFALKDVCAILEMTNPTMIADRLDDDEKLNKPDLASLGQRGGWIINESGLYSVLLRSDKQEAKPFRKWVTSEVLPSIRKTGSYKAKKTQLDINSTKARNSLTDQWKDHGLVGSDYAKATVEEYRQVFKSETIRKPDMTPEEKAKLLIFETMEMLKLQGREDVQGLPMVKSSITETASVVDASLKLIGV